MNDSKILVAGSLAFDVIFSIPGDFRQSIAVQDGQIKNFNATYIADSKSEYPGGTAGNIAAWCGSVGTTVSIFSAWGKDLNSKGYQEQLEQRGHHLRGSCGEFTAHCYNVSDPLHQQLVIWQPNHYEANRNQKLSEHYTSAEIKNFEWAIFAAGTPDSIVKHMVEFKAANAKAFVMFDPGQVSPFFTEEQFKACVKNADLIIGNQTEGEHFERYMHNFWPENIIRVTTLGAKGLSYKENREAELISLPAPKVEVVKETTGAGDALRAGLVQGLSQNKSLKESLTLGMQLAAASVALPHPQPDSA
jgi:adenosine kinase